MKVSILKIAEQIGTPFYLFYKDEFCENYHNIYNSFSSLYPNYKIAYSYKTNYTPYVCKLVKNMGGYAEVVSDMEYTLAKDLGYPNNKIIYNGPNKGKLAEEHFLSNGILNVDSYDECYRWINIAKDNPNHNLKIGIRLNVDIGAGYISRFGIEPDNDIFNDMIKTIVEIPNLSISGLHLHISRARNLSYWEKRMTEILRISDAIFGDNIPDYIDIGSGMYGDMEPSLRQQFEDDVPTYEQYAQIICKYMNAHFSHSEKKPTLFTEPGTTVVSKYFSLITSIESVKTVRGKNFAIVDSDFHNAGEICLFKKLPYKLFSANNNNKRIDNCDIVGYTCLEQDCLFQKFPEKVKKGDIIEFRNVGGYSIVYKPPFICPNCQVYSLEEDNTLIEIKRKELFDDIFSTYKF